MLDLTIKGGQVVTPAGVGQWDIGIIGEKIAAVATPGTLPETKKAIDATGKIVVPGGVEAHTHVGFPHLAPGWGNNTAGPEDLSLGALWGGTTTMMDFASVTDAVHGDMVRAVNDHMAMFKDRTHIDYSAHCTYRGPNANPKTITQIKDLIAAGFPSIKIFTTNHAPRPNRPVTMIDMGQLVDIMRETAEHGGIVAIHAEDDEIVQYNYARAAENQTWDWYYLPTIRTNLSEDISVRRVIRVAEHTGSAMYIVHTSAKEGVNAIAESRSRGYPVYGETILLYASFNSENYKEHDGMKYHTYPATKSEEDRLRLWDGLIRGDLSILATDAIATDYAGKTRGRTVVDVQGGNIGIEIRMGVAYSDGVVKQGMSLERYVDIMSTNPAKILGFYPQKGAIATGSDADITIIDPNFKKTLSMEDLHLYDYNPWEGWQIEGWPVTVTLRGKVMIEDRKLVGKLGEGKLIHRKIAKDILTSPAV